MQASASRVQAAPFTAGEVRIDGPERAATSTASDISWSVVDQLIENKRAAGRPRDLDDLAPIRAAIVACRVAYARLGQGAT